MSSKDPELGKRVGLSLKFAGLETPMTGEGHLNKQEQIIEYHTKTMYALGLDLDDDSLAETPQRVAKMYCQEVFSGLDYDNFPKCTTVENKMQHNELIIVNADVLSMCEHHFVPFIGECHVGYIPSTKVLGLSKIPRVVEFFSRRPQIQERLTAQVHCALKTILETEDIAVTMKAEHMCMRLRGVQQQGKYTITSKISGKFFDKPALREEFLMLTRR